MKKMVTTPSSVTESIDYTTDFLTQSSEETIVINEGANRIRCSLLLGLAISMGASSFLVVNSTQAAFAAEVTPVEKNDSNPSLIINGSISPQEHEVKPGETLFSLSQNYQIEPEAIASVNHITPQTDLVVGQTLKIPTSENQLSTRPEKISSVALDQSLNNLKESRRKLQESLAALRSNQIVEQPTLLAETPTSSEETTIQRASDPMSEIDESSSLAIELNRPIPIAVPTPNIDNTQVKNEPTLITVPEATTTTEPQTISSQPIQVEQSSSEDPQQTSNHPSVALQSPKLITPTYETLYHVQPGDTIITIAESHGISVQALKEANQITDPNTIRVNQSLIIPSNTQQSSLNSKLPPVPSVKPITTTPIATRSETVMATQPAKINVEAATPGYTEKLRDDFAHLEQIEEPSTQSNQVSVSIPVETNVPQTPQSRNSEWDSSRNSAFKRPQNIEAKPTSSEPTIVGTAAIQVEPYMDDLKIPVGTTVDPEIPSLPNPNQYLPDTRPSLSSFIWPAKGTLSSGFGRRWGRMHRGIDIAAPVGTPIIAAASGEVISSGWNNGGYGNLVKVQHADGSITLYAHNSRLLVRRGQQIEQGQQIAQMGSTGFSTGPHLHFEIHTNGKGAVNPIAFLPKKERR